MWCYLVYLGMDVFKFFGNIDFYYFGKIIGCYGDNIGYRKRVVGEKIVVVYFFIELSKFFFC